MRIAIFIDIDNFSAGYRKKHSTLPSPALWATLNKSTLAHYARLFMPEGGKAPQHVGSWVVAAISEDPKTDPARRHFLERLDREQGYLVRYGTRAKSDPTREKGVDTEIVCQMLVGGFKNDYDVCVLFSDDADYIPVVNRLQDDFGKKVIQAGFMDSRLRGACFGHLALEDLSAEF